MKMNSLISLIGPFPPLKGGISAHTKGLKQSMMENGDLVYEVPLKRVYPTFLRPDPYTSKNRSIHDGLVPYNPFTWDKWIKCINWYPRHEHIFQYWTPILAPCYYYMAHYIKGRKVLDVHNIVPHEKFPFAEWIFFKLLKKFDMVIVHSEFVQQRIRAKSDITIMKMPLKTLPFYSTKLPTKKLARKTLGIPPDDRIILVFGHMRKYKGIPVVIDAVRRILREIQVTLWIVGEDMMDGYLQQEAEDIKNNVKFVTEYVSDMFVPSYFAAADLVCVPGIEGSQSAVVSLAQFWNIPAVASKIGGIGENVDLTFSDSKELARIFIEFFDKQND